MIRLIDQLRGKHPKLAKRADHDNSRAAAIQLFCLECMGGSRKDASQCQTQRCVLWPYRPGAKEARPDGIVPTAEEYEAMHVEKYGEAQLEERRRRLQGHHKDDAAEADDALKDRLAAVAKRTGADL